MRNRSRSQGRAPSHLWQGRMGWLVKLWSLVEIEPRVPVKPLAICLEKTTKYVLTVLID